MGSDDDDHKRKINISHKVTLAAVSSLFAVTFLVILFFLWVRCRQNRRRERRRDDFISRLVTAHITPIDVNQTGHSPQPPKTTTGGLDPQIIDSLPQFVYKSSAAANHQNGRRGSSSEVVECAVCLSSITDDSKVRLLPNCKHLFHVECIDLWLGSNTTCPLCRAVVEPRVPQPTDESGSEVAGVSVLVQPTAPPLDELSLLHGEDQKASGSGSSRPLSSFRKMLSRERSSTRSSLGNCSELAGVVDHHELERQ